MKESNLTRLAEEEAAVIAEYFDVPEPVVERDKLYRIQAGAFRLKANAEAYLADIKAAGLDAYITTQAD
ncbi:MAG: SPOR domain-containing protein [Oscillospiraceae bacterium]|nr:SPOR domain-containing protein [Oscillospiraceae bacterium]